MRPLAPPPDAHEFIHQLLYIIHRNFILFLFNYWNKLTKFIHVCFRVHLNSSSSAHINNLTSFAHIFLLFSDSGSYRNQGLVNATILAFFMTSCQPFSCVPTCADQYIIVNKHARSAIGQNC